MKQPSCLALQRCMIEKKKTLALAESCTGGYLSHLITQNSGASQYFLGSFVTYSNELKNKVLGVPFQILSEFGSVSFQTASLMLKGLLTVSGADFGIAVTGIAGPEGGCIASPVGTVWMAIGERDREPEVAFRVFSGDRQAIIRESSHFLLESLYKKIQLELPCF